jgi:phosphate/sulfate permease
MSSKTIIIIFGLIALPFAILWNAFVGNVLWGWFVTPVFGIAAPGVALFFGLAMIIRYLTFRYEYKAEEKTETHMLSEILFSLIFPAFALLMGWIATLFIGA